MQLIAEGIDRVCADRDVYETALELDGKRIVELGCGSAQHTRAIARGGGGRSIIAYEVDERQHRKNLAVTDLPNVEFRFGGAEHVALGDASADVVFMFKSLHHVPVAAMPAALREIARILKPGGFAYISEPLFAGTFNDIVRLFHDEQAVRRAAFESVRTAVEDGVFELVDELFFRSPVSFRDFAEFEERILNATHTDHRLPPALYTTVKAEFERHCTESGALFEAPMRVDLLRKPA